MPSALTLIPLISPTQPVSGLGENAAHATSCTDSFNAEDCGIAGTASVALVSARPFVNIKGGPAALTISSVQTGDNFNIFEGSSIGTLTEV
jgi:hypothetical protein